MKSVNLLGVKNSMSRWCLVLGTLWLASSPALSHPLHDAVRAGDLEAVTSLLATGSDANEEHKPGLTPLHIAARENHLDVAIVLTAYGANTMSKTSGGQRPGDTPLHVSAFAGSVDVAQLLLANGADVNATARDGATPLHRAVQGGSTAMVRLVIGRGADVNAKDDSGRTPLDYALDGEKSMVAVLEKHGARCTNC